VVDDELRPVARQTVGDRTPDALFDPDYEHDSDGDGQRTLFEGLDMIRSPAGQRSPRPALRSAIGLQAASVGIATISTFPRAASL
jgi:hypothetical protein